MTSLINIYGQLVLVRCPGAGEGVGGVGREGGGALNFALHSIYGARVSPYLSQLVPIFGQLVPVVWLTRTP